MRHRIKDESMQFGRRVLQIVLDLTQRETVIGGLVPIGLAVAFQQRKPSSSAT